MTRVASKRGLAINGMPGEELHDGSGDAASWCVGQWREDAEYDPQSRPLTIIADVDARPGRTAARSDTSGEIAGVGGAASVDTPGMLDFARIWLASAQSSSPRSKRRQMVATILPVECRDGLQRFGIDDLVGRLPLMAQIASRCFGGWSNPRRPRDPIRARRRVSSARRAYYAWRRHAGPAQQGTQ